MNYKASARPSPFAHLHSSAPARAKPARNAADGPDDEDDLADDPDDDEAAKKAKKAKRAKRAKEEDDQDEQDEADPKASAARQRERERVEAIVTCEGARQGGQMAIAAMHLAMNTGTSRRKAIATLATLAGCVKPGPAAAAAAPGVGATASAILAANARARGERAGSAPMAPPEQEARRVSAADIIAAAAKAHSR